jgi:hypothetical protein
VIRRALSRLAARLPERVQLRLNPRKYGFRARDIPPPVVPPTGSTRLYVAPVNFAGQGQEWARAAERLEGVGARSMSYSGDGGFAFRSDDEVPVAVFAKSREWQRRQFRAVSHGFTHVLVEAERPLFGSLFERPGGDNADTCLAEIEALRAVGLRTAMLCHGSDIRLPSRHAASEPDSPFAALPGGVPAFAETDRLEATAVRHRELLDHVGGPVFVSTPDLLDDVPEGIWLPVVVAPHWFAVREPVLERPRPVVVHVPSRAGIKGSALIEATMQRLDAEGLITFERREGVPAAEMPEVVGTADIVLDQFALGSYGVAACEALAAGRLVICHVGDGVREHVRETTQRDVPLLEARASELERVLREVVADRARFQQLAEQGREFAREVHDGRRSARVLQDHFLTR